MLNKDAHKSRLSYLFFLAISIFLVSASVIALQIALQRFLSIVLTYHFVFVVISIALFGMSLGSLFSYLLDKHLNKSDSIKILYKLAIIFYLSLSLSFILCLLAIHYEFFQTSITIYAILFIIPFIFSGMFLARVLYTFPEYSGQLYASDMVGAACGCIGIIVLLNNFDLAGAIFIIIILPLSILAIFYINYSLNINHSKLSTSFLLIIFAAFFTSLAIFMLPQVPVGNNSKKEIHDALHQFGGQIIDSQQSAAGRVDLVKFSEHPELMDIYVDGTAGMPMYKFSGDFQDPGPEVESLKEKFPGYFPLQIIEEEHKDTALIIGPGGGRDILLAKMAGFEQITAVEVNKDIIQIVKQHSEYNGGIYNLNSVELVAQEGRNFLQSTLKRFDTIMFSLPVTNTSQGLGSYALTENFLYTSDAISEYMKHLKSQGSLVIVTHNDLELLRLLSITLDSFQAMDISTSEAMQHIYILGSNDYPVLVVKKEKFAAKESKKIFSSALQLPWILPGSSFFPQVKSPYLNQELLKLENNKTDLEDLVNLIANRGYDISPVTDQDPFFYKLETGLPDSLSSIFYASLILVAIFITLPLCYIYVCYKQGKLYCQKVSSYISSISGFSIYFTMLGLGFIIIEISMIQRFMQALGTPVFSMTTVLFTILLGAGLGSWFSSKLRSPGMPRSIILSCLAVILMSLFYVFSLNTIFELMGSNFLILRIILSIILLLPLGFSMGFPLPLALRIIKERDLGGIIPWMLAINGASSVLGSALAIILAISYGYNAALLTAAACYLLVLLLSYRSRGLEPA
ncbi:MAG: hypothetical protein R6U22_02450 [Desulfohalobiaceae bacterium]